MKLSNFRIKDKLSQKPKLQPLNTPTKEDRNEETHSNIIHDQRFANFLSSFQNLINSLTKNHTKPQLQNPSSTQQSKLKSNQNLDYRDRYVFVQLPDFENGKIDLKKLESWIGEVCQQTLSVAFHFFTEKKMNYEQMKIFASESLLRNLSILVDTYNITVEEIKFIDKIMDDSVFPYLKARYPLTVENDVNKALQSVIEEIDNSEILANDYFFSSDIHFEYRESGRYDDLIMRLINEVLTKIDMKVNTDETSDLTLFKDFQTTMNNIFQKSFDELWIDSKDSLKEPKIMLTEKQKQKYRLQVEEYTHYSVSRKISQNTQLYTEDEIKSGYLSVKSSTILRILTKWCDELWEKFENENYYRDRTDGLSLIYNKKVGLVFPWLKSLLTEKIKAQKKDIQIFFKEIEEINYVQQIELLRNELENDENPYIEKYEKVVGKFACKVFNNIEHFIVIYLNRLIHGLVNVSKKCFEQMKQFPQYWPTPYNLLSFKIGDLLRCKYSSKQKEVLKIFKEIERISKENEDKLKIIRIKNRLKKGTNDILINAKLNNSITCEIQLAVNSANSDFMVCSNYINHYIYELQRSRFGPISEICSIWKNYEKRSKQFEKMIEKQKPHRQQKIIDESQCVKQSKQHETVCESNPFICSQCNRHHYHNNYIVNHLKCTKCKYYKCAVCLIEENVNSQNKDFFLKNHIFKNDCKFWKNPSSVPTSGICIFINRTKLQPIIYIKVEHNFKQNLIRKLNNEIVIMREVSRQKELNQFLKECILFQMPERNTHEQFGKENVNTNQNFIINLFIPEYIKNCLRQEKETISILREDHLTKVDFDRIISQYRQKLKSIKSIEFSSTKLTNLDIIYPEFVNLKRLNINLNSVEDVSKITQFKKLQNLSMNENQIKALPEDIDKLQELKELDVYNNKIETIPLSLINMRSLTIINLSQNKIKQIPQNINDLYNLRRLILKKNQITKFPHGLGKHKKLETINLQINKIQEMPEEFQDLSNLTELILNFNKIKKLPQKMSKMGKLSLLEVKNNEITIIPKSIQSMISLQNMNFGNNKVQQIPDELVCLQKLTKLFLNSNVIKSFNECIFKLVKLRHITLDNNRINDLPDKFETLKQLQILSINNNLIQKYPLSTFKLQLKSFVCSGNPFESYPFQKLNHKDNELALLGTKDDKIKKIICQNVPTYQTQIKRVTLRRVGLQEFPEFIFSFQNLQQIDLSQNSILSVPDSFSSQMKIKQINLSQNRITSLPPSILRLKNLTKLQLRSNQLSQIPNEATQLSQLIYLGIGKNKFKVIPQVIEKFESLKEFYFGQNQIQVIPQWISTMKQILVISGQANIITSIPLSICRNSKINRINLSSNKIEVIPEQINQMTGLKGGQLYLLNNPLKKIGSKQFVLDHAEYQTKRFILSIKDQNNSQEIPPIQYSSYQMYQSSQDDY